jgi:hypothetical protein
VACCVMGWEVVPLGECYSWVEGAAAAAADKNYTVVMGFVPGTDMAVAPGSFVAGGTVVVDSIVEEERCNCALGFGRWAKCYASCSIPPLFLSAD